MIEYTVKVYDNGTKLWYLNGVCKDTLLHVLNLKQDL